MKHQPSPYLPGWSTSRLRPPAFGAKYKPRWPGSIVLVAHPGPLRAMATSATHIVFLVSVFMATFLIDAQVCRGGSPPPPVFYSRGGARRTPPARQPPTTPPPPPPPP